MYIIMRKNRIDVITLGCSKNLVDSELLMKQLLVNGYTVSHDPEESKGDIVVINTCGFIGDAKEQSINTILQFAEAKKKRRISKLFVMGCLTERYMEELKLEIPEVDAFYGKFNWKQLISDLGKSYYQELSGDRMLTTPKHYAYLKISEGCNRTCSYCSIPIMTGKHQSRSMEDILEEVKGLVNQGVKEFQVIAQDLTFYGLDLYKEMKLPQLIERIAKVDGVRWIRLHYAYPSHFPLDLLRVIRENDNVCNYLDIALQHISDNMLSKMRRNITKAETYKLLDTIRKEVPGIHLRTTLMVGHPGETEQDFNELIQFVKDARFERLGAFPYSHEDGTYAYDNYNDEITDEVKQNRMNELMTVQEQIALEVNEAKIGRIMSIIVDKSEEYYYIGRSEFDSPEVDPEVLIKRGENQDLKIGEFVNVKVTGAQPFDLYGELV